MQDIACGSCGDKEKSAVAEITVKGLHYCLHQGKYLKWTQMY